MSWDVRPRSRGVSTSRAARPRSSTAGASPLIRREGKLSFHHFDPVAQALSKAERGHEKDLQDIREMIARGLVNPAEALAQFEAIEPDLYRFPAIDPASFRTAVNNLFRR